MCKLRKSHVKVSNFKSFETALKDQKILHKENDIFLLGYCTIPHLCFPVDKVIKIVKLFLIFHGFQHLPIWSHGKTKQNSIVLLLRVTWRLWPPVTSAACLLGACDHPKMSFRATPEHYYTKRTPYFGKQDENHLRPAEILDNYAYSTFLKKLTIFV